jgi:hypothetical protein
MFYGQAQTTCLDGDGKLCGTVMPERTLAAGRSLLVVIALKL